jgi:CRP/FNR family transcriptional regulator, cyclic AMP receptor protein
MAKATAKKIRPTPSNRPPFDLKVFLDTAGVARHIVKFRKSQKICSRGDPAKGVHYVQQGGVKLSVINEDGKRGGIGDSGPRRLFW